MQPDIAKGLFLGYIIEYLCEKQKNTRLYQQKNIAVYIAENIMRNDKDFISDHIVNIRERLKNYSKENIAADSVVREPDTGKVPVAAVVPEPDPSRVAGTRAARSRITDALKMRSELAELLAGDIARIRQDIQLKTEQLKELDSVEEELRKTPEKPAGDSPAEAGAYFRTVEAVRLDYIRCLGKYSARQEELPLTRSRENSGGFPEHFAARFTAGAAFHLVLALSIILAAFITGIFFFVAINGGI